MADPAHFCGVFRVAVGVSPRDWRASRGTAVEPGL
ncbi:AraC-like DNA-binding protein [Allostreptomyces psammosilenae]|uniref:AraC-like DNA-binding protein n=1 Tax=Allostreptomyces psammosilenae TaxID=1892865 RepID=A0A852ZPP5_9ACTN|nr:AraC-like DNA-binding protein [Allostreptomyces psammosilenae]